MCRQRLVREGAIHTLKIVSSFAFVVLLGVQQVKLAVISFDVVWEWCWRDRDLFKFDCLFCWCWKNDAQQFVDTFDINLYLWRYVHDCYMFKLQFFQTSIQTDFTQSAINICALSMFCDSMLNHLIIIHRILKIINCGYWWIYLCHCDKWKLRK